MGVVVEDGPAALSPKALQLWSRAEARMRRAETVALFANATVRAAALQPRPRIVRQESPTRARIQEASHSAATAVADARRGAPLRRAGRAANSPMPPFVQAGGTVEFVDLDDPEVARLLNWDRHSDADYLDNMRN
jgi:hypothetical protein